MRWRCHRKTVILRINQNLIAFLLVASPHLGETDTTPEFKQRIQLKHLLHRKFRRRSSVAVGKWSQDYARARPSLHPRRMSIVAAATTTTSSSPQIGRVAQFNRRVIRIVVAGARRFDLDCAPNLLHCLHVSRRTNTATLISTCAHRLQCVPRPFKVSHVVRLFARFRHRARRTHRKSYRWCYNPSNPSALILLASSQTSTKDLFGACEY